MKPKPHVSEEKKKELVSIVKLMQEYPVVGLIDLTGLPSAQYQSIRAKLKSRLLIKVTLLVIPSSLTNKIKLSYSGPYPTIFNLESFNFFEVFLVFGIQTQLIYKTGGTNKGITYKINRASSQ